ncbi:histidine kinase [Amycolatopsis suaedae]|uniref:Histidine kinase n=1 Tax=Amycolatopsis suaedae TaxID=2510978 RepID=A0A4Q7J5P4_9PSEU|nr:histidine kinase [Amycolatopsis suaedae]
MISVALCRRALGGVGCLGGDGRRHRWGAGLDDRFAMQPFTTYAAWSALLAILIGSRGATRSQLEVAAARQVLLDERARIARELHDVVAHHVSTIAVTAETAPYRLAALPDDHRRPRRNRLRRVSGTGGHADAGQRVACGRRGAGRPTARLGGRRGPPHAATSADRARRPPARGHDVRRGVPDPAGGPA